MYGAIIRTAELYDIVGSLAYKGSLSLRPIEESAAEKFAEWFSDLEVSRWLSSVPDGCTVGRELEWIKKAATDPISYTWGIFIGDDIIGNCSLNKIDSYARNAMGGMVIADRRYWNCGIATAAARAMLHFAFEQMNLRTVYSWVFEPNEASLKHIKKLGFQQYGLKPDAIFANGQYYGSVEFFITEHFLKEYESDTINPD